MFNFKCYEPKFRLIIDVEEEEEDYYKHAARKTSFCVVPWVIQPFILILRGVGWGWTRSFTYACLEVFRRKNEVECGRKELLYIETSWRSFSRFLAMEREGEKRRERGRESPTWTTTNVVTSTRTDKSQASLLSLSLFFSCLSLSLSLYSSSLDSHFTLGPFAAARICGELFSSFFSSRDFRMRQRFCWWITGFRKFINAFFSAAKCNDVEVEFFPRLYFYFNC